jgi:hypothetical protein
MKRIKFSALSLASLLWLSHSAFASDAVSLEKPLVCVDVKYELNGGKGGGGGIVNLLVWSPIADDYRRVCSIADGSTQCEVRSTYQKKGTLSAYSTAIADLFQYEPGQSIDFAHAGQPVFHPLTVNDDGSNEIKVAAHLIQLAQVQANLTLKLDSNTGLAIFELNYQTPTVSVSARDEFTCWNTQE